MLLVKRLPLKYKETEGKKFFYMDVGSETHGRPSFRLWVTQKLVQEEIKDNQIKHYLKFPVNAEIVKTEKGTLVLRPAQDTVTYNVLIPCGYRGSSSLGVVSPETAQVYLYKEYSSPLGNLGVSKGGIVVAPLGSIKVQWDRSGRLYGAAPSGVTTIYPDGREETIDRVEDIEDVKELSQLLK